MSAAWTCRDLAYRYPGADRPAVDGISLEVRPGMVTAVIGPNGSGKSTLLRLLLGVLQPEAGEAAYAGRAARAWPRGDMARRVGVVPQGEEVVFPVAVRELVGMGRYPHLGRWQPERTADRRAIARALRRCDLTDFADRPLDTLSGGERQRARVARALAQEPEALALDEPTVALDVRHEMGIFALLRRLVGAPGPALHTSAGDPDGPGGRKSGEVGVRPPSTTVLLVTHNLNLAARYADRLVLLDRGRLVAEGTPAEVLTRERIERVYGWPVRIVPFPGPGPDTGAPQVLPLAARPGGTTEEVER